MGRGGVRVIQDDRGQRRRKYGQWLVNQAVVLRCRDGVVSSQHDSEVGQRTRVNHRWCACIKEG